METVIITALFAVSGLILMMTESRRLSDTKQQRSAQQADCDEDAADHNDETHFLDLSGGTLGI